MQDGQDDKTVLTNQHLTQHLDLAQLTHLNCTLNSRMFVIISLFDGKKVTLNTWKDHVNESELNLVPFIFAVIHSDLKCAPFVSETIFPNFCNCCYDSDLC